MPLDRPLFVVAPPRCGTSLVYRCLAHHPDVGHFNRADGKLPDHPRLAALLTRVGGWLRIHRDTPRESRDLWRRFLPHRGDDLATAADATQEARDWYEWRISAVLRRTGARRFAAKLPSHALQVDWLAALWPDARFIQPLRDWRAVVASTIVKRERDYADRWFGVRHPGWQEQTRRPIHLAAAWNHRVVHERLVEAAGGHADRWHLLRYEELIARPQATLRRLYDFADLAHDDALLDRVATEVTQPAGEWRRTLTPDRIAEIEAEHGDALRRADEGADG